MKSVIPKVLKLSQVRLFSVIRASVPKGLREDMENNLDDYYRDRGAFNNKGVTRAATEKMLSYLTEQIDDGCQESTEFLNAFDEFKKPENKELFFKGASENGIITRYFPQIISFMLDENLNLLGHNRLLGGINISPHSDGSRSGEDVHLTVLTGEVSDGSAVTYTMDINKLFNKSSSKDQEILTLPIFKYLENNRMTGSEISYNYPIFHRDDNGILKINFSYDSKEFLYRNDNNGRFSAAEIEGALNNLHQNVDDMRENGELEPFLMSPGDTLAVKNDESLHGVKDKSGDLRVVVRDVFKLPGSSIRESGYFKLDSDNSLEVNK